MTTTNPTSRPIDPTRDDDSTTSAPGDPRPIFAAAVATAGATIDTIRADQLDGPTPCDDFDVRGLLGHMVGALRRVAVVGRGLNVLDHPAATPGVPDDGWPAVWAATADEVEAVWADDALLERTVELPWATLSGAEVLASYTGELTLHTWDLATATGRRVAWDPRVVSLALGSLRRALPAEGRAARYEAVRAAQPAGVAPMSDPFGEVIEVSAYATLIDQLVAWSGRRP
jgi:uncharacterized protein (TIGR03086 family)